MNRRDPWYLTSIGVFALFCIQLVFTFALCACGVFITGPEGGAVGWVIGIICTVFGFPTNLILRDGDA